MDKKRYTPIEKVKILREVLEEGKSVSAVAESYGLHPNNIFNWKKQFFEGAVKVFEVNRPDISVKAEERRIAVLEEKLAHKDGVIATLTEELLGLKKNCNGLLSGSGK